MSKAPTAFTPAIILFGKDEIGKAHASVFDEGGAELAAKAAEIMGIQTLRVESDEHRALAAKIPRGKIFASGRAFVPLIRAALYDQLVTAAGGTPTEAPSSVRKGDLAAQWDNIDVGCWVLACTDWREGWWESHVLEVKGDLLKLKFRHWPDVPPFSQRRTQVALLHPKART
jgi:hypothetical protein